MARVILSDGVVLVVLSKRNLLALLHKLDMLGSARTITNRYVYRDGVLVDDLMLVLRCEDDRAHYAVRDEPGRMHPDTERAIGEASRPVRRRLNAPHIQERIGYAAPSD